MESASTSLLELALAAGSQSSPVRQDRPMDILEEQNFYVPHLCRSIIEPGKDTAPEVQRISGTLRLVPKGRSV